MNVYPVIMCGGSGTRLWPASRPSRPKQFIPLTGPRSLFQETVERARRLDGFRRLTVVAGAGQAHWLTGQLAAMGVDADVILEPEGRDSAPAVAVAAHHVRDLDPDGTLVILASDHHVPDAEAFRSTIGTAAKGAQDGRIVTLGIRPREPSSAYGYIRSEGTDEVRPVAAFVEKPDAETAQRYMDEGYLWNSGNFIARADTLLSELDTHAAEVSRGAKAALDGGRPGAHGKLLAASFAQVPKISVDYAVMERTKRAAVVPSDLEWSDLGAWDAVYATQPHDDAGNAVQGESVLVDVTNSYIRAAEGRFIVAADVDGLAIVDEDDVTFVTRLDRAQRVKDVVEELRRQARAEIDRPRPAFSLTAASDRLSRWLRTAAWPLWWSLGYDRERDMWRESLSPEGKPTGEARRARVQGRQTFVFAAARRFDWAGPWQEAVAAGCRAMETYRDADGFLRTRMNADGEVLDDETLLYDQTFVLLALAEGADVIEGAEEQALALMDRLDERFGYQRGYRERGAHPFQSNAHMHLFEAAQAWFEASGGTRWRDVANGIAMLARDRFVDAEGGFLREFFDGDWLPAAGRDGGIVEPGHQFEWAWLFARWTALSNDSSWLEVAARLFDAGMKGVDPERAVALDTMDTSLRPVTERARLWHQTEWLKAALILARMGPEEERERYHDEAQRAFDALMRYLDTEVPGLWRDKLTGENTFSIEPSPASSLYHIVAAAIELKASAEA